MWSTSNSGSSFVNKGIGLWRNWAPPNLDFSGRLNMANGVPVMARAWAANSPAGPQPNTAMGFNDSQTFLCLGLDGQLLLAHEVKHFSFHLTEGVAI